EVALTVVDIYVGACDVMASSMIYSLSLHDALPISGNFYNDARRAHSVRCVLDDVSGGTAVTSYTGILGGGGAAGSYIKNYQIPRSEEHTSELQSRFDLVCRLLLEKKDQSKQSHSEL